MANYESDDEQGWMDDNEVLAPPISNTSLRVDYEDDILAAAMDGKRQYQMINNPNGTVSFIDVTEYTQRGDTFSSGDINNTNELVNENHTHIRSQASELSNHESRISTNESNIATNTINIAANARSISDLNSQVGDIIGTVNDFAIHKFDKYECSASGEGLYPNNVIKQKWGTGITKTGFCYLNIGARSKWCLIFYEDSSSGNAIIFGYGIASDTIHLMRNENGTWTESDVSHT